MHLVLACLHVVGDLAVDRRAGVVGDRRVGEQIGHAPERGLLADRQLQRRDTGAEHVTQLVERPVEAGPLAIELVDEDHPGDAEWPRPSSTTASVWTSTPSTALTTNTARSATRRAAVDVRHEVGVAGTVEDVDLVALELERGEGRGNRDAALDLLGVEIGRRGAVLDPALAVHRPCAEQQCLSQRGLPGASVADERDVTDLGGRESLHGASLCSVGCRSAGSPRV